MNHEQLTLRVVKNGDNTGISGMFFKTLQLFNQPVK